MKALTINGKLDLSQVDLPDPEPAEGQVRLRPAYVGICGSDLHYYFEGANGEYVVREPLIPGHEISATVDLDPSGTHAPGTPVTIHPAVFGTPEAGLEQRPNLWPGGSYLGSASTMPHTQGAMSEFRVVNLDQVRVLPDGLPLRRAALAEPLGVALHALTIAEGVEGKDVLVSGAGPIGLLCTAAAVIRGAASVTVTDVLPEPLRRATTVGASQVIDVSSDAPPALSYDVAFECSGFAPALSAVTVAMRRARVIVQVGMFPNAAAPINLVPLVSKELRLRGCFRFASEVDDAVAMLAAHPEIDDVVTHEFEADQAQQAFETAKDSRASGKVLVKLWT